MPLMPCEPARPSPLRCLLVAASLGGGSAPALAQDQAGRVHELTFGASASETAVVTVRRAERVEEAVTQLSPNVRWSSYSGRLRGSASYSADFRHFAGNNSLRTDKDTLDNRLSANVRAELVDNTAYVDLNGSIGQQALSAADAASVGGSPYQTSNQRSEVVNLSLSPYVVGSLAGLASYELRYSINASDGSEQNLSRRVNDSLSLSLRSQSAGWFGWGLSASSGRVDFGDRGANRSERITAELSVRPDVDWRLSVNAGQERTDVGTLTAQSYETWGGGVQWTPSPRTSVDLSGTHRYFGNSRRLSVQYRSPRTVWVYSDVRDLNNGNQFGGVGQPITLFQLFFAQFASIQPDPALRELLVLQYIASIGRRPDEVLFASVVNPGISVQQRRDFSMAWAGLRMAVTVQAFSNNSRTLDGPNTGAAAGSAGNPSRQRGLNASASYRLTPQTTATAAASLSRAPGGGVGGTGGTGSTGSDSTELRSASFSLSSQLGRRTSASLTGRYSVFSGGLEPYREATLTASINLRF